MWPEGLPIFVATAPVDMRRAFDGLSGVVRDFLRKDPQDSALFIFYNRRIDRLKAMWWDKTGYCLLYKRLERGRFRIPKPARAEDRHVNIDAAELELILDGIQLPRSKEIVRERTSRSRKRLNARRRDATEEINASRR